MSNLPEPLTPPECDLTDFQYMELDVRRLRDSKFSASVDGEAFRAGILLWCAAWHQIPAGSLPDDDIELANLAGYGRVLKEWKKVRAGALHNFVKCSDGRLYHPILAEKALAAYSAKLKHAYDKFCDRIRKENSKRAKEGKLSFGIPSFEQWNSGDHPNGIPPEKSEIPAGENNNSNGKIPEQSLKGNGEGEGTELRGNGEGEGDFFKPPVPGGTVPPAMPAKKPGRPKIDVDASLAWQAYIDSYWLRYQVEPVRNATTNAQMANFVRRLGAEAPAVAEFYLAHNKGWYVQQSHCVGAMLSDAETLRTQWATGRRVTATSAQQADRTQTNGDVFGTLIAEAEQREAAHGN